MQSKIIEATNGFNWGKFCIMRPDTEWSYESQVDPGKPLLRAIGWHRSQMIVYDFATGEGGTFRPGGLAAADLRRHCIRVCPMFEPFLEWLLRQDCRDLSALPSLVELDPADTAKHSALWGYRRPGEAADATDHSASE